MEAYHSPAMVGGTVNDLLDARIRQAHRRRRSVLPGFSACSSISSKPPSTRKIAQPQKRRACFETQAWARMIAVRRVQLPRERPHSTRGLANAEVPGRDRNATAPGHTSGPGAVGRKPGTVPSLLSWLGEVGCGVLYGFYRIGCWLGCAGDSRSDGRRNGHSRGCWCSTQPCLERCELLLQPLGSLEVGGNQL